MQLPYIPADVPFTGEQKAWFAGFLAGLNTRVAMPSAAPATAAGSAATVAEGPAAPLLQIAYGTQTGNAEWIAEQAATLAAERGLQAVCTDLEDLSPARLAGMSRLLVVCSTYGEGEMPDAAEDFWLALAGPDAPRLEGLHFAVLALGDSVYDGFCQAGKNLDGRLAELGAARVVDRGDCDLDFQSTADEWLPRALDALSAVDAGPAAASPAASAAAPAVEAPKGWGRKNPYPATVTVNRLLSAPGSAKEVRHLEIALGDSGIDYQPGDGLSVVAANDPALVDRILARLGATGEEPIADRSGVCSLRDALTDRFEIATASKYLVDYIAARTADPELEHLSTAGDHEALDAWLWGKDVLDLLNVDPSLTITPDELIAELRPLSHRVYSISSSRRADPWSVSLTVATVRYRSGDRDRGGVCSTMLADRCPDGAVQVYVTPNKSFRLPAEDVPVIMIGPGTGIAPFRSFLQERAAAGATGENWLFFGDQHRETDFLYADELAAWQDSGVLTRLDLAFSRDQAHKVYVQDAMTAAGAELFAWLQRGAHLYVCGDATRMAHDVDEALAGIVAAHGGFDADGARAYLDELKTAKRYLRDVY
ncbi:sulfite reductase subunit alpha [Gordonia sp. VNK21]|uniref:sulfite reductase subunit alpha n=1 Tax=Gordonia sp. VNK21 TaxID=3382483 RepID=UPI0038D4BC69